MLQQGVEIGPMPVQITGDHHLVDHVRSEDDDIPPAARSLETGLGRPLVRGDDLLDVCNRRDHDRMGSR